MRKKKLQFKEDRYGVTPIKRSLFSFDTLSQSDRRTLIVALSIFGILCLIFITTFILSERAPFIISIEPKVAIPGDEILINGKFLKSEQELDRIEFSGRLLTDNLVKEWSSEQIKIQVPESVGSGMIYITTKIGKSNGLLFTNVNHLPIQINKDFLSGTPSITNIIKIEGVPGKLVVLKGERFGNHQIDSALFLKNDDITYDIGTENPFAIELWSDREIHFRLPSLSFDGSLLLQVNGQIAAPLPCEIDFIGGMQSFSFSQFKISYQLAFQAKEGVEDSSKGFFFYRTPPEFSFQQIISKSSSGKNEFVQNGVELVSFSIPSANEEACLFIQDYTLKTVNKKSEFDESRMQSSYDESSHLYSFFTEKGSILGDQAKLTREIATSLGRQETSIGKARANYRYVINRLTPNEEFTGTIVEAAEKQIGDYWHYSSLFIALCRLQGVPARQIAGLTIIGDTYLPHIWSEFYIEGYGWISVDPWFADQPLLPEPEEEVALSATPQPFIPENPFEYYFGKFSEDRVIYSIAVAVEVDSLPIYPPSWRLKKNQKAVQVDFLRKKGFLEFSGFLSLPLESFEVQSNIFYSQ